MSYKARLCSWSGYRAVLGCLLAVFCSVCGVVSVHAATDLLSDEHYSEHASAQGVPDPIEPFNRMMFTFNDKVYFWVLDPVATGYSKVLPLGIRKSFGNFFNNLGEPVRSVNCLLQGRFRDSGLTLSRFVINSVCGILGLGDPASRELKIQRIRANFGQTLSVWGLGDGLYLVVPFLGPSTLRDFSGDLVDMTARSLYYPWNNDFVTSATAFGIQETNYTSLHLGLYQDVKSMSFDPYIAFRNAYFQSRSKVSDRAFVPNPAAQTER